MNKRLTRVLAVGALIFSLAAQSNAVGLYYLENATYIPTESGGGGYTYLDPQYATHITSSSYQAVDAENLIEAGWPTWNVSRGSDAPGNIEISWHAARQWYNSSGAVTTAGGDLKCDYIGTLPSFANYRWIQVIYTNSPPGGASSPYLDPVPNSDILPFYWDEQENITNRVGMHYKFEDGPYRAYNGSPAISWNGALFLAEWTQPGGGTTLVIRDGLWWGWRTIGPGGNDFWGGGNDASVPEPGTLVAIVAFAAAATRKGRTKR